MRDKKKILLLGDDLTLPSGVGVMSKEIVLGTIDEFDWVQIGGAMEHPDNGKVKDLSNDVKEVFGVEDPYLKLYCINGYGNPSILRQVIDIEKPDAIIHFTDPRFWEWLYQMEREIRMNIPILYYTIWDDLPDPAWNDKYYASCDSLYCISKQTYGIVNRVLSKSMRDELVFQNETIKGYDESKHPVKIKYIPHGINTDTYFPIDENHEHWGLLQDMKKGMFGEEEPDFVLFYNSRNIRRKMTSDIIVAFKDFLMELDEEKRDGCKLVLHTTPVDNNGTDLPAVIDAIVPEEYKKNVIISGEKIQPIQLNCLYNIADVTILISSNEGFGLGTAESISAGTPIIVNVTGGLQDQCGFKLDGEYLTPTDYLEIGSLHRWRKWMNNDRLSWGEWVIPVWSSAINLVGSPPTPYIYDDRVDPFDVKEAIKEWYFTDRDEIKEAGKKGREWLMNEGGLNSENMASLFKKEIKDDLENFKPRKRFEVRLV